MKAPNFDYVRPGELGEALALIGGDDVLPLAGGQSLMPMMNFRLAAPELLVDLDGLAELKGIRDTGGEITIGAMTRLAELARSEVVAAHLPLVTTAVAHIAHPAIRNRGTIGGSIALADPAAEMPAVLLALDATIHVASADGERRISAGDFFTGLYETALEPAEIITAISIPKPPPGTCHGFQELSRRHGDYAMVGVALTAASVAPLADLRIVFFAVADRAIRVTAGEAALNGRGVDDAAAIAAACAAVAELDFLGDLQATAATKRHLAQVLLKRTLGAL